MSKLKCSECRSERLVYGEDEKGTYYECEDCGHGEWL